MKLQQKIGFHNKFKLEVVRDGKVIQEGFAENIVLDRMYTKLCILTPYYGQIVYGRGTGTLDATRDTLFSRIGNVASSVVSRTREANDVLAITSRGTIGLTTSNGETITEVGISEHSTYINTHALITDSEGNPISITKTDLDIIYIYATVYIEIDFTDYMLVSDNFDVEQIENKHLMSYILQCASSAPETIYATCFVNTVNALEALKTEKARQLGSYGFLGASLSFTGDVTNKKTKFSRRIETNQLNNNYHGVSGISFDQYYYYSMSALALDFMEGTLYSGHTFTDKQVGVGDGTITKFNIHRDASVISVKVDAVATTAFTYKNINKKHFFEFAKTDGLTDAELSQTAEHTFLTPATNRGVSSVGNTKVYDSPVFELKEGKKDLNGHKIVFESSDANYNCAILLWGSVDGETWVALTSTSTATTERINTRAISHTGDMNYIKYQVITYNVSFTVTRYGDSLYFTDDSLEEEACLIFDTAPAVDEIITASYTVPYIPKDSDHVIDIDIELVWGEGSA